jgi:hypothetical protein
MQSNSLLKYNHKIEDNDNILVILYNELLLLFDGQIWGLLYISDVNLPETEFSLLKKPGLTEISAQNSFIKTYLVTGGFIPKNKEFVKTVYILNIKKNTNMEGVASYDCLLDLKYGDMKSSRFLHGSINLNDQYVVVFGGKNDKGWLNTCEFLNLKNGEWKDFPPMNSARANFDFLLKQTQDNKIIIYVYGGYSGLGQFSDSLIEYCIIDTKSIENSQWKNLKLTYDNKLTLPKLSARIINYDENILIIGGSDGKHLIGNVFEWDTSDNQIKELGQLLTARNNFHILIRDGDILLVGGSCKKYSTKEDLIENYVEKFTFNLANQVESTNIPLYKDIFLNTFKNLSIDENEFLN